MEKELKKAIDTLTKDVDTWNSVKKILLDEIKSHQDIIEFIDRYQKAKEDKFSKQN